MRRVLNFFASLRLTVWLLLASLLLIFFGTLDQVELGVRGTQMKYFESFIATWGYPPTWPLGSWLHVVYLPIPGGYLLGPLLVLNLFGAHFRHFRPRWSLGGIVLIHFGVLMLIFSQLATQLLQKEYYIWFDEGETVRNLTSYHENELAITDVTESGIDTVHAIPASLLRSGRTVTATGLPFSVEAIDFYENAAILQPLTNSRTHPVADRGLAITRGLRARPLPPTHKANERNATTAHVRLYAADGQQLGTWLVSNVFEDTMPEQRFTYEGRDYTIALRFSQEPLPYALTLLDFAHDRYPGTDIPNNFSSRIKLTGTNSSDAREVLISMNHPLRYDGLTFYQSAFRQNAMGREDGASRLQVVRNPGWLGPYIACTLVSIGLVWQFGWGLLKFGRRRKSKAAAGGPRPDQTPPASTTRRTLAFGLSAVLALGALAVISTPFLRHTVPSAPVSSFDLTGFGQLAVLDGGRLKPLDTLARNTLILTRSKQTALDPEGRRVPAIEFLAQLFFDPTAAAEYRVFRLDNPDLLDLVGQPNTATTHLSYTALRPLLKKIDDQAQLVPEEAAERTPYHNALIKLHRSILRYQTLENGILPQIPGAQKQTDALQSLLQPATGGTPGIAAFLRQQMDHSGLMLIPATSTTGPEAQDTPWISPAAAMLGATVTQQADPMLTAYLQLSDAWREDDGTAFSSALAVLQHELEARMQGDRSRPRLEYLFNRLQPFYLSLQLYLLAFVATALFWLLGTPALARAGIAIAATALLIHTFGLVSRIYLSGYAPVTNLYSSSVFIGWVAVLLSLPFERLFRNGLITAAASLTGFATLIIAHNLAISGGADTMEMMRAVLDSNFWLSTHVTTVTIGYSTTFLAGALGILYVLLHLTPRGPDAETLASLKRMVYGLICFALLFSFVGTILGGIWADQSWGRFWGWDPKENGALMIVLWNALILHGLRTSMVGTRGLMLLAIAGNIITSWSWFGTNMLGVGLHSYGFMDQAFLWLMAFWISQLALIALGFSLSSRRATAA